MSDREERRERRERRLQTVAFFGAVLVLGSVLYAAFVVQQNRAQETLPTPSPSVWFPTPYTPTSRLVPTPAGVPYPWIHPSVRLLATPGITPYPVFVFIGPDYPYMVPPDATPMPGAVRYRPEHLTPMAGPWVPQVYPTGGLLLVPWGTTTPSASPTPLSESPTP